MATRQETAKARIREALRNLWDRLDRARQQNIAEADTSTVVLGMLGDILGYDKVFEATGEYKVKGQYADYAVKLDGKVKFFVEVKAIGIALNPNHLRQVTTYAVNEGVDWVVLTNGCVWQLYHIDFDKPINVENVFEVDLTAKDWAKCADMLYLLSRQAMLKDEIGKYWADKVALSAPNLVRALLSEDVLTQIRREFKQLTGYRLDPNDIGKLLLAQVIRPELAQTAALGRVASRAKRAVRKTAADSG